MYDKKATRAKKRAVCMSVKDIRVEVLKDIRVGVLKDIRMEVLKDIRMEVLKDRIGGF